MVTCKDRPDSTEPPAQQNPSAPKNLNSTCTNVTSLFGNVKSAMSSCQCIRAEKKPARRQPRHCPNPPTPGRTTATVAPLLTFYHPGPPFSRGVLVQAGPKARLLAAGRSMPTAGVQAYPPVPGGRAATHRAPRDAGRMDLWQNNPYFRYDPTPPSPIRRDVAIVRRPVHRDGISGTVPCPS